MNGSARVGTMLGGLWLMAGSGCLLDWDKPAAPSDLPSGAGGLGGSSGVGSGGGGATSSDTSAGAGGATGAGGLGTGGHGDSGGAAGCSVGEFACGAAGCCASELQYCRMWGNGNEDECVDFDAACDAVDKCDCAPTVELPGCTSQQCEMQGGAVVTCSEAAPEPPRGRDSDSWCYDRIDEELGRGEARPAGVGNGRVGGGGVRSELGE